MSTAALPAAPERRRSLPPRRAAELVRSAWDGLAPHGAVRVAAFFHAALGDPADAGARPGRRTAVAAQGRRMLRLLPTAVEHCDAAPGRLAAMVAADMHRMPAEERAAAAAGLLGDEDLPREAPLRTLGRFLGEDGLTAEARAAWGALCAALAAAVAEPRPAAGRGTGGGLPRAA